MDINKRYKRMKIMILVLVFLSIGLFLFQNIGLSFLASKTQTQYYMASKDIQPYTEITADLFTAITVDSDKVPTGFITNFSEVEGTYTKDVMHKGEYLTKYKFTTNNEEKDCIYTMEINADYSGPLEYDTYIDIYTLSKDNVPSLLFSNKKLYSAGTKVLANAETEGAADNTVDKKYIKVTKQEMLEYYSKLKSYSFIVLPVAEGYVGQESNATIKDVTDDANTKTNNTGTFVWEVKENETFASIAQDWGTTEEKLKELNPDVKEVKTGIKIDIPEEE